MKRLPMLAFVLPLVAAGCGGAGNYAYIFDLTDPGARNANQPGQRDMLVTPDVTAEILIDPTSFEAVLLDLTNHTDQIIQINYQGISMIMPDGTEQPLQPDSAAPPIEPGAKLVMRLVPFRLPAHGPGAAAYDNQRFELVVPMMVRGVPQEQRYHFVAHLRSI